MKYQICSYGVQNAFSPPDSTEAEVQIFPIHSQSITQRRLMQRVIVSQCNATWHMHSYVWTRLCMHGGMKLLSACLCRIALGHWGNNLPWCISPLLSSHPLRSNLTFSCDGKLAMARSKVIRGHMDKVKGFRNSIAHCCMFEYKASPSIYIIKCGIRSEWENPEMLR